MAEEKFTDWLNDARRRIQIIRIAFGAVVVLLGLNLKILPAKTHAPNAVFYTLAAIGVGDVGAIFFIRSRLASRSQQLILSVPQDATVLKKCQAVYVSMYGIAVGISVFGFAAHIFGFNLQHVSPFF
ncbi:MAG TPA: hypothetical protein VFM77_10965, partial [Terriglobales bacterium]|nr:hypothetical protein [Terriglobales bacterium]